MHGFTLTLLAGVLYLSHEVPSKGECQAAKLEQFQAAPVKCQHHEMLTESPAECGATEPA